MTDYEYDEDLPFVVVAHGVAQARFRTAGDAWGFLGGLHISGSVIDTTPKPRVPDDAKFITWLPNGSSRWYAERRNGDWSVDGATYDTLEDLPGVTPDTVFTVLDARDERGSDDV